MIRNKAIVNEENSDAEYWKQKYLALVKNGGAAANSNGANNNKPGFVSEGLNSGLEGYTPSWNSILTK